VTSADWLALQRLRAILRVPGNKDVVMKLVRWTVLMFSAPLAAYYVALSWLDAGPIYAGVAAIVTVQFVMGGYVAMAFGEDLECDQGEAQPPRPKSQ
jgi:hypothetical protein